MNTFTVQPVPLTTRVGYGFLAAFLWVSVLIWIPILGWFLILFTPLVFCYPIFVMKARKSGKCPHCDSAASHLLKSRSFKCGACRQMVIVTETEFRKA